jgi:superfamily II DNA or RNA helicase
MSHSTQSPYDAFLASKRRDVPNRGPSVDPRDLHPALFPFQRAVAAWAIRKGRAAIFETTGLGKTLQSLVWADRIAQRALILAPLAVTRQTVDEGRRWGIPVAYARSHVESPPAGITITNYEMLDHFDASAFGAVVLDESSILKNFAGKTKKRLIDTFRDTPFRLCCTATPAPNDTVELCNHADFLGVASPAEMISTFFTPKGSLGDGRSLQAEHTFRLKGHARAAFWAWLASWSVSITAPSDLGFADAGYVLPPLRIVPIFVESDWTPPDQLLFTRLRGVTDRARARRSTLSARVAATVELIAAEPDEPWIVWCGLNDEANAIAAAVPDAVNVEGKDSPERKADELLRFAAGETRVLATKPGIAAFGLNLQRCARVAFVGLSDSWERYFQAIRRCWRFGQTREVRVFLVLSDVEADVYNNVMRKEQKATELSRELVANVAAFERAEVLGNDIQGDPYAPTQPIVIPSWLTSEEGG